MNELEQYLDTIESYAMVGEWDAEAYDEAVQLFLRKRFRNEFDFRDICTEIRAAD